MTLTDLPALLTHDSRTYRNEAWTRERAGAEVSGNTLGMALDGALGFARGRNAWISVRRQRLLGLVGARRRGGRQAWEVDYLIDATPRHEAVGALLERALTDAGRAGAEKLFLRLAHDSDLFEAVREAGFLPYQEEVLYARVGAPHAEAGVSLRGVTPSDAYLLYRLYNQSTPEATRRSEAASFNEWHAAQERRWQRNAVQLVEETEGRLSAWVKAARLSQGVVMELIAAEAGVARTAAIVAAAARALSADTLPLFILVPRASEELARRIVEAGFQPQQEFVCLMRRTTRVIKMPALLPAIAKNAVGVRY